MRGFSDYRTGNFANDRQRDGRDEQHDPRRRIAAGSEDANNEFFTATSASLGDDDPAQPEHDEQLGLHRRADVRRLNDLPDVDSATPPTASRASIPGGVNFLFSDGSVHFLKNSINRVTIAGLGSRNGGEVVSGRRSI